MCSDFSLNTRVKLVIATILSISERLAIANFFFFFLRTSSVGVGSALPDYDFFFCSGSLFPVQQQTTSGIGHRLKYLFRVGNQ